MSDKTTGAVRSADSDQLDFTSLPIIGLFGVARTAKEGATKYARLNYMKGFPVNDILNHALIHIYMFLAGDRSEPNLEHAAWGLLAAVQQQTLDPAHSEAHLLGPGAVLTKANLDYLAEQEAVLGPKRAAGEFAGLGDWKLGEVPQIARILNQRFCPCDLCSEDACGCKEKCKIGHDPKDWTRAVNRACRAEAIKQGTFSFEAGKSLDGQFEVEFGRPYPDADSEPRHKCCYCTCDEGCTVSQCHAPACVNTTDGIPCRDIGWCGVTNGFPAPLREIDQLSDKVTDVIGPTNLDDEFVRATPCQDAEGTIHFPKPVKIRTGYDPVANTVDGIPINTVSYREPHGQESKSRKITPASNGGDHMGGCPPLP